nr:hypothetical protein [Enterobacter roggenkampii]
MNGQQLEYVRPATHCGDPDFDAGRRKGSGFLSKKRNSPRRRAAGAKKGYSTRIKQRMVSRRSPMRRQPVRAKGLIYRAGGAGGVRDNIVAPRRPVTGRSPKAWLLWNWQEHQFGTGDDYQWAWAGFRSNSALKLAGKTLERPETYLAGGARTSKRAGGQMILSTPGPGGPVWR